MTKKSKRIPVSAASEIGKKFEKDQVILLTWDSKVGDTWVTTWGCNAINCIQAAEGGNILKRVLGWPNDLTLAKSPAEKRLRKKILDEVKAKLNTLDKDNYVGLETVAVRDIIQALKELE